LPSACDPAESAFLTESKTQTRTVFRWAGSKKQLLPSLIAFAPSNFSCYFEPFVGSGCLFFSLRPKRAVLGDINAELIDAYTQLRDHPTLLHRRVLGNSVTKAAYYRVRKTIWPITEKLDRAARFVFLNRLCFNGLYRTNQKGEFNVPFGDPPGNIPDESDFRRASIVLRNASLIADDFETTLATAQKGDFVYLDPPYVYAERKDRGEYGPKTFTLKDIDRLISAAKKLDCAGVKFLLSYLECDDLLRKLPNWSRATIPVRRHISGFAKYRRKVNEVVIRNY
jgi:DNA adenine methylase